MKQENLLFWHGVATGLLMVVLLLILLKLLLT